MLRGTLCERPDINNDRDAKDIRISRKAGMSRGIKDYRYIKEEVICRINPANCDLFAGLIW